MTPLAQWQRQFLARVCSDEGMPGRWAVYQRNLLANLHAPLAAAYPVVRRLVGDAFFREAAARFARAHPSRSGDLHRHGAELAAFLERYAPARDLPCLPDVARLEWACAEAFHAADGEAFDFAALAALPASRHARVRLQMHPAVRLLRSPHPVASIWEANQPERDGTPGRLDGGEDVLVYRDGFTVRVRSLSAGEWRLLAAVRDGATLGELAGDPALAATLQGDLVAWTARGVIAGFTLASG